MLSFKALHKDLSWWLSCTVDLYHNIHDLNTSNISLSLTHLYTVGIDGIPLITLAIRVSITILPVINHSFTTTSFQTCDYLSSICKDLIAIWLLLVLEILIRQIGWLLLLGMFAFWFTIDVEVSILKIFDLNTVLIGII